MTIHVETPEPARAPLRPSQALTRLVLIGVVVVLIVATFAFLGGWLTPFDLTPARFVDGFQQVDGVHPGCRRNHAKGLGVSGFFESNGSGARLSKAAVFRPGQVPVLGRFSLGGGQPHAADAAESVRGLGLQFNLPDGEVWRTAMINLPVFPFRTPEAFYENLLASKPDPQTGKPDAAKMKAFADGHPETVRAIGIIKSQPLPSGFANTTYHGLNAFRFTNLADTTTPVRWTLAPLQPFELASGSRPTDKNYLFDALIADMHRHSLRWRLNMIVGQPGDPTNDASAEWPAEREKVVVGTLTLDRVESDDTSPAAAFNFDPLVLPAGMAPSDDPLLSARSAVYSQSYTRRAGEPREPSAVTPAEVRKGE
jgi:catalase